MKKDPAKKIIVAILMQISVTVKTRELKILLSISIFDEKSNLFRWYFTLGHIPEIPENIFFKIRMLSIIIGRPKVSERNKHIVAIKSVI